ncbi:MAG: hypothetical protein ABIP68_05870, partial [Ferruginibacter sp.]
MKIALIHKRIYFDEGAKGLLIILFLGQLFFTNGGYLFFGTLCLGICLYNLQQPLKPSVFTIIFIYHFIQISANIWLSNYLEKDINFRSEHSDSAILYSYIGLMALFAPIIYYQNKIPDLTFDNLRKHAERLSLKKSFRAYIIAFFVANALGGVAFVFPGLAQAIFSFINIKWFFFLLFGYQVFLKKRMVKEFVLVSAIEFVLGFLSFFSDFKTVFFFLAFLALSFIIYIKLKHLVISIFVLFALVFLGIKWTSIKGEYRSFLNQGTKSQHVGVSSEAALNKLIQLGSENTENLKDDATYDFLDRIQYTYHLAKTMDRVPSVLPYENGGNIAKIFQFVLIPRILNPNKPRWEATVKTKKYTGLSYAGYTQGVSFSLGYFADCYIDFGYYGMMIPLFLLGIIMGGSYFYFVKHSSSNYIFNFAVVGAMFMEFNAFEMDGTFLLGRLYSTLVVFYIMKLFFFNSIYKSLKTPNAGSSGEISGLNQMVSSSTKT